MQTLSIDPICILDKFRWNVLNLDECKNAKFLVDCIIGHWQVKCAVSRHQVAHCFNTISAKVVSAS